MIKSATRERSAAAPARDLWPSIPLELIASVVFILAAAGLKLAGIFP